MSRFGLKLLLVALIAAVFLVIWRLGLGELLTLESMRSQLAQFDAIKANQPVLVSVVFFGAYVLVTALSIPGAAVMTLLAGALFGFIWGLALVSLASTLGALLAFLAARLLLGDWIQGKFGERLASVNRGLERDGAFYLFSLRMVPVLPFFLVNLVMGLTAIKASTYTWVSWVGMLAGTAVYVNAGTQLSQVQRVSEVFSVPIVASFVLLALFPWLVKWVFAALGKSPQKTA